MHILCIFTPDSTLAPPSLTSNKKQINITPERHRVMTESCLDTQCLKGFLGMEYAGCVWRVAEGVAKKTSK